MALIGDSSAPGGSIHEFYLPKGAPRRPAVDYSEGIFHYSGGRKLLDASSGPVVSNIGHGNKRVIAAMVNQAQRSAFATYRNFESEPNVELANLVCKLAGPGFDRAFFVSGGSEAIEAAIKLVRQYFFTIGQPSKWKIISRNPSYHGGTLGALSLTGDPAVDKIHGPILIKWPKVPTPFNYRVPGGKSVDEYEEECARALEDTIVAEGPDTVMAFILEPVGGLATGALVASERYMNRVREICTKYGVLLIYDEVMSGSGRTGKFFAAEHWPNARPDIIVAAKGLAAGYVPFGACIAPDWIVRPVADNGGFSHGHTCVPLRTVGGDPHSTLFSGTHRPLCSVRWLLRSCGRCWKTT
ncbi:pyridoxal phosphate-dependent transferase [Hyaloraphidium curvatum]|nr:pyridoxal phosphate-dependent transferase [Hyaloraphidium curvatum]